MSRAELHAITEIDLQRFDYRERVQRLKQRVIAAKTNSLPVMSTAEFFAILCLTFHREECQAFCISKEELYG